MAIERHRKSVPSCALHGGVTVCPVSQECARFLRGTLMTGKYKYDAGNRRKAEVARRLTMRDKTCKNLD